MLDARILVYDCVIVLSDSNSNHYHKKETKKILKLRVGIENIIIKIRMLVGR